MGYILFVCVKNACRSQMAEAFFNRLSETTKAFSAGIQPAEEMDYMAVDVMKEVGIDKENQKPKLLTREVLEKAERVITMGCLVNVVCPFIQDKKTVDWSIRDPTGGTIEDYRKVRDEIKELVESLIE